MSILPKGFSADVVRAANPRQPPRAQPVEDDGWEDVPAVEDGWEDVPAEVVADAKPVETEVKRPGENVGSDPGFLRTIAAGLAQGATKRGVDELGGLAAQVTQNPGIGQSKDDVYRRARNLIRKESEAGQKHRPWTSWLAEVGGDLGSDFLLSKIGVPVGSSAYQAVSGGLSSLLGSDAELTSDRVTPSSALQAGLEAGAGAGLSYLAPKVLTGGAKKALGVGRALKDFAEERAVKVLGRDLNGLIRKGEGAVHELGRDLLDNVLEMGMSTKGAGKAVNELADVRGQRLGGIKDMLDDAAKPEDKLNVNALYQRLKDELASGVEPAERSIRKAIMKELRALQDLARPVGKRFVDGRRVGDVVPLEANLGIAQAEKLLKQPAQDAVNYEAKRLGPNQEALRRYAAGITKAVEDNADEIAEKRAPDLVGEFQAAKKAFGNMAEARKIAAAQAERDLKNNLINPTDYLSGAGAAAAAGPVAGVGMAALNHLVKGRGNSVAALGADKLGDLANALKIIPTIISKLGPAAPYGVRLLLRDYPEVADELLGTSKPQQTQE